MIQIQSILVIGDVNKISLIPFVCKMISEQSEHYFADTVEKIIKNIALSDEQKLALYLRPDIKEYIDNYGRFEDDIDVSNTIDRKFYPEHPKEKIAYLYYMGKKGSTFGKLNSGSRMCRIDEDPEFLFNMPFLCFEVLRKGLREINTNDTPTNKQIRSSMQSLLVESYIKYIHAALEVGLSISDLYEEIEWLLTNYSKNKRWLKLVSKTECLNELFI